MQGSGSMLLLSKSIIREGENNEREREFEDRVEKVFLWIKSTSKDLSEVGIKIHHPDPLKRVPKEAAKIIVEIAKTGVDRRTALFKEVLRKLQDRLLESGEATNLQDNIPAQSVIIGTKYDAKEILRSHRYEYQGIPVLNNRDVLDYIAKERTSCFPINEYHLRCIEKLWKLLRVQIKILSIQLYSSFTRQCDESICDFETKVSRSPVHVVYSVSKPHHSFARSISEKTDNEEENGLVSALSLVCLDELPRSEEETDSVFHHLCDCNDFSDSSVSCRQSMSSKKTHHVQDTKNCFLGTESNQTTPRDHGYCSKSGDSATEDLCSNFDSQSVETDLISQDAKILSSAANFEENERSPRIDVASINNSVATKSSSIKTDPLLSSDSMDAADSWDEIYEVVERFSQNTLTLLSWIDEMKEVSKSDENSPCFFDSQRGRRDSITKHAERVHNDVINDAAILLRHLPCETDTITTVLKKVEFQCASSGVSLPSEIPEVIPDAAIEKRLDPGFLSSKLKRDLDEAFSSYQDFKPQATSSPYAKQYSSNEGARNKAKRDRNPSTLKHDSEPAYNRTRFNRDRNTLLWPLTPSSRRNWNEFMNEWESVHDWLERMDLRIHQAEMSDLTSVELEELFEKYMHQFKINNSRKEFLNIKANYIGTMYPELDYYVHERLQQIEDLWSDLKLRLCNYLTPISRWKQRDKYDYKSDWYPWHKIESLRFDRGGICNSFDPFAIFPDVQMSDFTFYQIRDRLGVGGFAEKDGKTKKQWPRSSSSSFGRENKNLLPNTGDLESSATTIFRPNKSNGGVRWAESETLESDVTDSFAPELERRHKPTIQVVPSSPTYSDSNTKIDSEKIEDTALFDTSSSQQSLSEEVAITDEEEATSEPDLSAELPLRASPQLLSSRIKEFHLWLKSEELEAYEKSASIGWDPNLLKHMLSCNQNRLRKLSQREATLKRICASSEQIMKLHLAVISEYFLLWSTWMIEQRYYNLILFSVDMECILERRIEILTKKNSLDGRLSHPLGGVWTDRGENMVPTIKLVDEDYDIFFRM